ncbi:MAG: head GIN domain-containing protein [Bacteroidota bacterium]
MRRTPLYLTLLILFLFTSVQAQELVRETRRMPEFYGVEFGGIFDVSIEEGDRYQVDIETSDRILDQIKTEVRDGILHIKLTDDWKWKKKGDHKIRLNIVSCCFESINVSGAAKLSAETALSSEKMRLMGSGAAKIDLILDVEKLDVNMSGAANVNMVGVASQVQYDLSGAAKIRAYDLRSEAAKVKGSGAASVHVFVSEYLTANLSGAGNLNYRGNPEVQKNVSGVASISRQ